MEFLARVYGNMRTAIVPHPEFLDAENVDVLLVTSNRDYTEWAEAFGEDPLLASAALDRIAHGAHMITLTGASFRAQDRARLLRKAG